MLRVTDHDPSPGSTPRPRCARQRNGSVLRLTSMPGRPAGWGYPWGRGTRRAHLDTPVVDAGWLALDTAGVAAAGTALHLHARGPDQKVGRRGVHLAPRYLINDRPGLADCGDGFLCRGKSPLNVLEAPGLRQLPGAQAGASPWATASSNRACHTAPGPAEADRPQPPTGAPDRPRDEQGLEGQGGETLGKGAVGSPPWGRRAENPPTPRGLTQPLQPARSRDSRLHPSARGQGGGGGGVSDAPTS